MSKGTEKLHVWADLLLDKGKGNNLINFKDTKTGTAEIVYPDFATKNPAENLGLANKGSISIGKDADFAVVDENYEVLMTVRGGEIVYRKQGAF